MYTSPHVWRVYQYQKSGKEIECEQGYVLLNDQSQIIGSGKTPQALAEQVFKNEQDVRSGNPLAKIHVIFSREAFDQTGDAGNHKNYAVSYYQFTPLLESDMDEFRHHKEFLQNGGI